MAAYKKPTKPKQDSGTPTPGMLGTGMAAKAGTAVLKRKRNMCSTLGGKWVKGKCVY